MTEKPKNSFVGNKGFAHLILITFIAVVGIGAIGYFAYKNGQLNQNTNNGIESTTPAPTTELKADDTATWQTYTNKRYGYSLKYPPEYILDEKYRSGDENFIVLKKGNTSIIFSVYEPEIPNDIYESAKSSVGTKIQNEEQGMYGETKQITIDGRVTYERFLQTPTSILDTLILEKDGYYFGLQLVSDAPEDKVIFESIASTLKFAGEISHECRRCDSTTAGAFSTQRPPCPQNLICQKSNRLGTSYCVKQNETTERCE
jgi:hypothetical protein